MTSVIPVEDIDGPVVSVDDDSVYQELLAFIYSLSDVDRPLLMFQDGLACIDYVQQVIRGETPRPAVILMDLNMPVTDGAETIRRIRAIEDSDNPLRIVMLSSSSRSKDIQNALESGADAYVEKPMDLKAMTFELVDPR